jgi:hypothetical protein
MSHGEPIQAKGVLITGDATHVSAVRTLSRLLDTRFVIPGTNIHFGLDAILGLVPGIGDAISAAIGTYIIVAAQQSGVPKAVLARMLANLGLDTVVGSVPILGTIFDVAFKANARNAALLEHAVVDPEGSRRSSTWVIVGIVAALLAFCAGSIALAWLLVAWIRGS